MLRRTVVGAAIAETLFFLGSLALSTIKRASDPGGMNEYGFAAFIAMVAFFLFALPALLLSYYSRWLVFAAALAGVALVTNVEILLVLLLN
ncbi:MAG: hypothetical protein HY659_03455 [Rhizobiales bacterium]|nr:hypothetical protein [Hyphomicrobiales bacterium]